MVIRLGRPRVCGIVHGDLLEVEVPLDARRDDVAERIRDAQQLLDAQEERVTGGSRSASSSMRWQF
jgi:hypothetical protein